MAITLLFFDYTTQPPQLGWQYTIQLADWLTCQFSGCCYFFVCVSLMFERALGVLNINYSQADQAWLYLNNSHRQVVHKNKEEKKTFNNTYKRNNCNVNRLFPFVLMNSKFLKAVSQVKKKYWLFGRHQFCSC